MKVLPGINRFRRSLLRKMTQDIGRSNVQFINLEDIKFTKILVSRPNHRLGNLLLLTPLIQEISDVFPNSEIDIFVKGSVAPIIFKNYKNVNQIIQLPKKPFSNIFQYIQVWASLRKNKYDLVINANHVSSSGKLSTLFAKSRFKFFGDFDEHLSAKHNDYEHNAKCTIYNFRAYLTKLGIEHKNSDFPAINIKLDKDEKQSGHEILKKIVNNNNKTICLFTNATGDKCYSELWWNEFYEKIKIEFPNYNIIELLPVENISKLGFKIPHFYSKDIREMGALIANTTLFIAADSGVMHLASSSETPTVGLFSVTNETFYGPYNKGSFSVNTNKLNSDEMIKLIKNSLNV